MPENKEHDDNNQCTLVKFRGIPGLVSFSTILPIHIHTSIEEMAKFTWFWPIIGGFIGIIVGTLGFLLLDVVHVSQFVAAALIYSFAIWFNGFHHLDGLIDFGDGMMVHGTPEKKIAVMRDTNIGVGGISYFLMVALITFTTIGSAPTAMIFYILFISEIAAKMGIVTCATFSNPFPNGTGRFFIESMNIKLLVASLIVTSAIGFLTFNMIGVLGIIGGLIGGTFIAVLARKNFKWATGDVLGTSNEVARMLALLIMTVVLSSLG